MTGSVTLAASVPELILSIGALLLLLVAGWRGDEASTGIGWAAVALLAGAAFSLMGTPSHAGSAYGGLYRADAFAGFAKLLIYVASAVSILAAPGWFSRTGAMRAEYPVLILLSATGMGIMASAGDLLTLYVGLELQSLAAYVLASFMRHDRRSAEAGLKYFVLGALASGILLYGISLLYGFAGTTQFAGLRTALGGGVSTGMLFGLVFVLAGLAFKISAVPFHMWTPDVYEGAPTPVTAFLSAAPKIGAMAILVRIVIEAFQPVFADWQQIVVFISIASMLLGSFAAIGQKNIKRLMAYSSIGHMGYALVGLAAGTQAGVAGVILYMAVYMVMTLGTFACILAMRRKEIGNVENVEDLAGLSSSNPFMAVVLTILMFSLAGIPPLAGFFGKYYVFLAAIEAKLYPLAIIGVIGSVVGAYYYIRVVKVMWFDEAKDKFERPSGELKVVYALSAFFTVAFIVFGGALGNAVTAAAKTFF